MSVAKAGDKVQVHYKGSLQDGEVFDSSEGQEPLEFVLGEKMVIDGFDNGVLGMTIGDSKTVVIPPDEGYGGRNDQLIGQVEKSKLPPDHEPELGMVFNLDTPEGPFPVRVTAIEDEMVTLDGNHPLADQTLTFEISLVAISA